MAAIPALSVSVESLIVEARGGSTDALNQLMEVCRSCLHQEVKGSVEGKLRTKVDESDLVQNSLMKAYVNFSQFRGHTQAELFGWLLRIEENNHRNDAERWAA